MTNTGTTPRHDDILTALRAAVTTAQDFSGQCFAVCVVDQGGHVLGSIRQDDATIAAAHSAETKARTAAYFAQDTGALPPDSNYIPAMTSGVPFPVNVFPGGLVLRRGTTIIGAVGVGGSIDPNQDLAIARSVSKALDS